MSKIFLFQIIQFSPTVLIQTIQFSISMQLILFNPLIGPHQLLPFRVGVGLGTMAMKGCSAFPKAPAFEPEWTWEQWKWRGAPHSPKLQHRWNLTIRLFCVISRTLASEGWRGLTPLQRCSLYSTAPPDLATNHPSNANKICKARKQGTAVEVEVRKNSWATFSDGLLHLDTPALADPPKNSIRSKCRHWMLSIRLI